MSTSDRMLKKELDELEAMIDRTDLSAVLNAIAWLADAKAGHIRDNWQDEPLARVWIRAMLAIEKVADSKAVRAVP